MVTQFTSRELVRDELVSKFVANGAWVGVYGYEPSVDEVKGTSPFLIIRSRGTSQDMSGEFTNKTGYRFTVSSWVVASSPTDNTITSAIAEDELDNLDKIVRQVIRDNAGGMTTSDYLAFEDGVSQVSDVIVNGLPYMVETRAIFAYLNKGVK